MTTSRMPAVIDALVVALRAGLPNVTVYDGQWVTPPATTDSFITVGWTPEGEGPSGEQTWAGLGKLSRDERLDVPCYCDAYSGDTDDVSTRRNAAFDLLAAAENALRADPTLGNVLTSGWAQIGTYSVRQEQTESGLEVGITFHVTGQARI